MYLITWNIYILPKTSYKENTKLSASMTTCIPVYEEKLPIILKFFQKMEEDKWGIFVFVSEGSQPPEQWKLTKMKREIFLLSPETLSHSHFKDINPKRKCHCTGEEWDPVTELSFTFQRLWTVLIGFPEKSCFPHGD